MRLVDYFQIWERYKKESPIPLQPTLPKRGDRIHIHSRQGIYEVIFVKDRIRITCNKWQKEVDREQREKSFEDIAPQDFKCYSKNYWRK